MLWDNLLDRVQKHKIMKTCAEPNRAITEVPCGTTGLQHWGSLHNFKPDKILWVVLNDLAWSYKAKEDLPVDCIRVSKEKGIIYGNQFAQANVEGQIRSSSRTDTWSTRSHKAFSERTCDNHCVQSGKLGMLKRLLWLSQTSWETEDTTNKPEIDTVDWKYQLVHMLILTKASSSVPASAKKDNSLKPQQK